MYLSDIGFSSVFVGVMEGLAEAISGFSKMYFGAWSDSYKRKPLIVIGYALSAIAKPAMIIFNASFWVLLTRSTDRFAKGIRSSARDAILSGESTPENKGKIFGFHRSVDTLGAVVGPLVGLILLKLFSNNYQQLFYWAIIPGALTVVATLFIQDKKQVVATVSAKTTLKQSFSWWHQAPSLYKKFVVGFGLFSLFNSADMFILLQFKNVGYSNYKVIQLYILFNLFFALLSFPLGIIADKIGLKNMLLIGLIFFSITYVALSLTMMIKFAWFIMILYGIYAACTDGITKAIISNITPKEHIGKALGIFQTVSTLIMLIASIVAGILWQWQGANKMFFISGIGVLGSTIFLYVVMKKNTNRCCSCKI
jgi:MFS family permease